MDYLLRLSPLPICEFTPFPERATVNVPGVKRGVGQLTLIEDLVSWRRAASSDFFKRKPDITYCLIVQ
jgi:hypothetical protein